MFWFLGFILFVVIFNFLGVTLLQMLGCLVFAVLVVVAVNWDAFSAGYKKSKEKPDQN
jgi:hypothetical protein